MKVGMLWFDSSKDSLEIKISRATTYYLNKYDRQPNRVYVWKDCPDPETEIPGVEVHKSPSILRNHFWIGRDD